MDSGGREAWGRWEPKYRGNMLAAVYVAEDGTARMTLQGPKLWQVKHVTAGGLVPAKMFAERWCAATHLPDLSLKEAVQVIRGGANPVDACYWPYASVVMRRGGWSPPR